MAGRHVNWGNMAAWNPPPAASLSAPSPPNARAGVRTTTCSSTGAVRPPCLGQSGGFAPRVGTRSSRRRTGSSTARTPAAAAREPASPVAGRSWSRRVPQASTALERAGTTPLRGDNVCARSAGHRSSPIRRLAARRAVVSCKSGTTLDGRPTAPVRSAASPSSGRSQALGTARGPARCTSERMPAAVPLSPMGHGGPRVRAIYRSRSTGDGSWSIDTRWSRRLAARYFVPRLPTTSTETAPTTPPLESGPVSGSEISSCGVHLNRPASASRTRSSGRLSCCGCTGLIC
jgi:hypothetical protein